MAPWTLNPADASPRNPLLTDLGRIIAENTTDADGDGLVDEPDDEAKGGKLMFTFQGPTKVYSIDLVDIEEKGVTIRVVRSGGKSKLIKVPAKGNGSLQTIEINEPKTVKLEVKLTKSGAVDNLRLCP